MPTLSEGDEFISPSLICKPNLGIVILSLITLGVSFLALLFFFCQRFPFLCFEHLLCSILGTVSIGFAYPYTFYPRIQHDKG